MEVRIFAPCFLKMDLVDHPHPRLDTWSSWALPDPLLSLLIAWADPLVNLITASKSPSSKGRTMATVHLHTATHEDKHTSTGVLGSCISKREREKVDCVRVQPSWYRVLQTRLPQGGFCSSSTWPATARPSSQTSMPVFSHYQQQDRNDTIVTQITIRCFKCENVTYIMSIWLPEFWQPIQPPIAEGDEVPGAELECRFPVQSLSVCKFQFVVAGSTACLAPS